MKNLYSFRKATATEMKQLAHFQMKRYGFDFDEALCLLQCAYIVVFDMYIASNQVYRGKVLSIVWNGSPSQFEVYIWKDKKIHRVQQRLEYHT